MKDYSKLISESPLICGKWNDINEVANYISSTNHSIILNGYLLYAYSGDSEVRSLIITTGLGMGLYSVSIFYDNFQMIYCSASDSWLSNFISSLSEYKKLKVLNETVNLRFNG